MTDITKTRTGIRVISPGSLHPLNISEGGDHGFFKLDPSTRELEFVKVRTRAIERVHAWDMDEFDTAVKPLLEGLPAVEEDYRPIIEIGYNPELAGAVLGTARAYADKAVFVFAEQIQLGDGVDMGERPVYQQAGMVDALDSLPSIDGEEEAMGLLRGVLTTPEPMEYIENYTKEVMSATD